MYETIFGLDRRPFPSTPNPEFFVGIEAMEQACLSISRTVERAEGVAMTIGPAGVGKSLLCHVIAEHLADDYEVVLLNSTRLCTRRALLQNILFELGLPYQELEEGELRLSLMDHLEPANSANGMVLIVDEAHTLPMRLLEEIRMITNLVRDGSPRVRLVLVGGPQLEELFANPKLAALQQRIATRCYLHALNYDETFAFVRGQITNAGGHPEQMIADEGIEAVYRATDGVPRLVNQLCDHALVLATAGGTTPIGADGIAEAWADLQQLPAPWNKSLPPSTADEPASSVVEFGELDDDAFSAAIESNDSPVAQSTDGTDDTAWKAPEDQIELRLAPTPDEDESAESGLSEDAPTEDAPTEDVDSPMIATTFAHNELLGESSVAETDGLESDIFLSSPEAGPTTDESPTDEVAVSANDPFAEKFDEEEIVIDEFAMLDAALRKASATVTAPLSHALAAVFADQEPNTTGQSADCDVPASIPIGADYAVEGGVTDESDQPGRTLVADSGSSESWSTFNMLANERLESVSTTTSADELDWEEPTYVDKPSVPPAPDIDDRDMIIVNEEAGSHDVPPPPRSRAFRREYRQLFAQLRRV